MRAQNCNYDKFPKAHAGWLIKFATVMNPDDLCHGFVDRIAFRPEDNEFVYYLKSGRLVFDNEVLGSIDLVGSVEK